MATIRVVKSPSGESVYAVEGDAPHERRSLLGYIGSGNVFFAARAETEQFHRQRWSAALQHTLSTAWQGRSVP